VDEKKRIANRVAVLALVRGGKSYRKIGEILWTSPVTVSTIKKNYWDQSGHYKNRLAVPKRKRQKESWTNPELIKSTKSSLEDFLKDVDLWELIKNPPRPPGIGLKNN